MYCYITLVRVELRFSGLKSDPSSVPQKMRYRITNFFLVIFNTASLLVCSSPRSGDREHCYTMKVTTENYTTIRQVWLILTNAIMMLSWAQLLVTLSMSFLFDPNGEINFVSHFERIVTSYGIENDSSNSNSNQQLHTSITTCVETITPKVQWAVTISFLEVLNSFLGITKSKLLQVLLFSTIRFGVEWIVTPYILPGQCVSWQHIVTLYCWSLGDTIRFGCFLLDAFFSTATSPQLHRISIFAKMIRYTVGPILFPLGTIGEMFMVLAVANNTTNVKNKLLIYGALSLWPIGFYQLFTQLLRQRQKFFQGIVKKEF